MSTTLTLIAICCVIASIVMAFKKKYVIAALLIVIAFISAWQLLSDGFFVNVLLPQLRR